MMRLLRRCSAALIGLFVDDGVTPALAVLWIIVGCLVLRHWSGALWTGPALFLGLAAIFAAGVADRR